MGSEAIVSVYMSKNEPIGSLLNHPSYKFNIALQSKGEEQYWSISLPQASSLKNITGVHYNLDETNNWLPNFEAIEQQDLSKVKLIYIKCIISPSPTLSPKLLD
mgnify:CR=1 FL=1